MQVKKILLAVYGLAGSAAAYANESMNPGFRKLLAGDVIHAVQDAYYNSMGSWFYFILAIIPYFALYMYQRSLTIATIWLVCVLVSYRYLLDGVPDYIFYFAAVFWVASVIRRVGSPLYQE